MVLACEEFGCITPREGLVEASTTRVLSLSNNARWRRGPAARRAGRVAGGPTCGRDSRGPRGERVSCGRASRALGAVYTKIFIYWP